MCVPLVLNYNISFFFFLIEYHHLINLSFYDHNLNAKKKKVSRAVHAFLFIIIILCSKKNIQNTTFFFTFVQKDNIDFKPVKEMYYVCLYFFCIANKKKRK